MRITWSLVGVLLMLAVAPGCKKGEGGGCFEASECAEGLACVGAGPMYCEKCDTQEQCTVNGKCTAKDGVCVAASDDECKKSGDCKARGPCTAKDGACVVGGDADCKQSEACSKEKFCVAKGNNCIMSDEDRKAVAKAKADAAAAKKKEEEKKEEEAKKKEAE